MSETRRYVILARLSNGGFADLGRVEASDSETAIRLAVPESGVVEVPGAEDASQDEAPDAYVAVSERNWVELPVVREVQTTLRIGEREFVLGAASEASDG